VQVMGRVPDSVFAEIRLKVQALEEQEPEQA
jgi:hypothetical protein